MGSARNLRLRAQVGLTAGLLMAAFFFYFDITQPLGVAAGSTYVAIVAVALVAQSKSLVLLFGTLGSVLTLAGFFVSHPASNVSLDLVMLNRGLSIFALVAITATGFVFLHKQERFDRRLMELASTDALTGLLNRRVLLAEMKRRMEEARRYDSKLTVMMLDIDRFKQVNDQYGHLAGDRVLKKISAVIVKCARRTDYLGRYGGEEFLLVCPNTDADETAILAERIRSAVEALEQNALGIARRITLSIGIAQMWHAELELKELIAAADRGLYRAKEAGRNQVCIETSEQAATIVKAS